MLISRPKHAFEFMDPTEKNICNDLGFINCLYIFFKLFLIFYNLLKIVLIYQFLKNYSL